jgi:hypothetical protein
MQQTYFPRMKILNLVQHATRNFNKALYKVLGSYGRKFWEGEPRNFWKLKNNFDNLATSEMHI